MRRREHEGATERGSSGPAGGFRERPTSQPHPSHKEGLLRGPSPPFPILPRSPLTQLEPCLAADGTQQRVYKRFNLYT